MYRILSSSLGFGCAFYVQFEIFPGGQWRSFSIWMDNNVHLKQTSTYMDFSQRRCEQTSLHNTAMLLGPPAADIVC